MHKLFLMFAFIFVHSADASTAFEELIQKGILSAFIHPHVAPNLYDFLSHAKTKDDILKNIFYTEDQWVPMNE